jgi:hypothetical protein
MIRSVEMLATVIRSHFLSPICKVINSLRSNKHVFSLLFSDLILSCNICFEIFNTEHTTGGSAEYKLASHVKKCHPGVPNQYTGLFYNHIKTKTPYHPVDKCRKMCQLCISMWYNSEIVAHINTAHPKFCLEKGWFMCGKCVKNKYFPTKNTFERHLCLSKGPNNTISIGTSIKVSMPSQIQIRKPLPTVKRPASSKAASLPKHYNITMSQNTIPVKKNPSTPLLTLISQNTITAKKAKMSDVDDDDDPLPATSFLKTAAEWSPFKTLAFNSQIMIPAKNSEMSSSAVAEATTIIRKAAVSLAVKDSVLPTIISSDPITEDIIGEDISEDTSAIKEEDPFAGI